GKTYYCQRNPDQRTLRMTLGALLFAFQRAEQNSPNLVERLRRREPQAMAELYDRYGALVYSLILRIVREPSVAEDLVQETFIRVWNRVQAFDQERGALGPWLLAVARNRAIDYLRSSTNRMARSVYEIDEVEHPSLFVNMEKEILSSDRIRQVRNALEKLN